MSELPEGVLTFLFTDVEGSTRLWEDAPDSMMSALIQHDEIIERAIAEYGGTSVKPRGEGDSRFLVFGDAGGAVGAIADIQRALVTAEWPTPRPIRIRAALHTGVAELQLGDYYGSSVNRAARLRAIAHGGQTVMSAATWELVRDRLPNRVTIRDMGELGLKDLSRPEHVYQIDIEGVPTEFPPLASIDTIPNNLPVQLTEFVGREQEMAEAKRLLESTRLLTIMAPGGAARPASESRSPRTWSPTTPTGSTSWPLPTSAPVARSSSRSPRRSVLGSRRMRTRATNSCHICRASVSCWCSTTSNTSPTGPRSSRKSSGRQVR